MLMQHGLVNILCVSAHVSRVQKMQKAAKRAEKSTEKFVHAHMERQKMGTEPEREGER